MGVFDQASRYVLKSDPAAFFTWRMRRFVEHFVFLRWLDTTTLAFPGGPGRICDTVAEFEPPADEEPRRLLDVEAQSQPHADMLERLGEYAYRLRRSLRYGEKPARKYQVVSVLLNLTGPEQTPELDMRQPELDDAGAHLVVVQVTFTTEDAALTLAGIASGELSRGVLPWIPLMQGGDEEGIMVEWRRLALTEPNEQRLADYGGLALVFADLADRQEVWAQALEGWNVKQSRQVLEWQAEARQEADLERFRRDILRALELRYRGPVPTDLAAQVAALTDLEVLSQWFDATQTADNLEAFRASIDQLASANGSQTPGN
jgi:hypothetical protein